MERGKSLRFWLDLMPGDSELLVGGLAERNRGLDDPGKISIRTHSVYRR